MPALKSHSMSAGAKLRFTSPLGAFHLLGYWPSNIEKYGVNVTYGTQPAAFRGLCMRYMSAITCQDGTNAPTEATCLANGWEMRDSGNVVLVNAGYGGALADPANVGYQAAWCALAEQKAAENGSRGIWIDDSGPRITSISGGVWPAAYPNNAAYETALLSFHAYVFNYFNSRGMKTSYNGFVVLDNDGSETAAWFVRAAPYTHFMTPEAWLTPYDPAPQNIPRVVGSQWYENWDGFRALHTVCNNAGIGFLPLSSNRSQVYTLATFLLDWRGWGANMWDPSSSHVSYTDPWVSEYATAFQLGSPLGAATFSSPNWTRQFVNGAVTVNSTAGTATIT